MKKVLMVFYSFAPINNCAAIPNTKLVKYLEREDIEITLVTNAVSENMIIDESLLPDNVKQLRRISVQNGKLFMSTVAKQRQKITDSGVKLKMKAETRPFRSWVVSLLKNTYFKLSSWDWVYHAIKLLRKTVKKEHFDVVYSSYPALGTHNVAEYVMRKKLADKWIADFRDPIGYAEYNKHGYKRDQKIQHKIEREADAITIVSEGAMEKFRCKGVPDSKITYIPNGFDHDDFDIDKIGANLTVDKLRIFYAGTLYAGKRDLSPMFKAISELAAEGKINAEKISIEYAGNEWPIMLSFAEKYGLENICLNYGFITRTRVMEIMSEIDCSIVCTHNTKSDKGVVTGKVFELLLVGKPIIAVVGGDEPDSELGNIVKQCNAGVVYEQANDHVDYENLRQWLKKKYDEKMNNGIIMSDLDISEREKYSYANIAHELYEIIKRVAN